ncbi:hypothetical protein AAX05_01620 [Moraxella bovoculi]|uniref:Agglutination protein n=1 Tax=Moraxella bovoculi TaxID=386891 RepID=A0AAC8T8Z8_9GAMM|nr:hypothetical protein AAX06_09610 [Moraxella bovoculi]AKG10506.1 hypothetical protein AAX05_01620 [Moraxella bovoculi]AKG12530.1 hypothetical protein AAX07_01660 [Moraxella bovoculi]AKG14489.1 hypothetical protein AAX11_01375 [Moraxella bovoculi]
MPTDIIAPLRTDFDSLTPSLYKDGSYRLRRYSKFTYNQDSQDIELIRGSQFVQSSELNKFQGDVVRQYDDVSDELLQTEGFLTIVDTFAKQGGLPNDATIEVHQMRIVSKDPAKPTITTPEGLHQDGFDRIGMFTVSRQDVAGGDLCAYQTNDPDSMLVRLPSETGVYCVMDDSKLWHYASELSTTGESGFWDLFVLTANMQ